MANLVTSPTFSERYQIEYFHDELFKKATGFVVFTRILPQTTAHGVPRAGMWGGLAGAAKQAREREPSEWDGTHGRIDLEETNALERNSARLCTCDISHETVHKSAPYTKKSDFYESLEWN